MPSDGTAAGVHSSLTEAAPAAGVTRQTVSEWRHHPAFQHEPSEFRTSALREAQQRVEKAALMAVDALSESKRDPAMPARVPWKNRAARLERLGVVM